ncbi:MAG: hypothetical protein QW594_04040 [Candidatus Woesearchaeota archaeon]
MEKQKEKTAKSSIKKATGVLALQCGRGTCPIRGPTKMQDNASIARRKERVLALASTMLLLARATFWLSCTFCLHSPDACCKRTKLF